MTPDGFGYWSGSKPDWFVPGGVSVSSSSQTSRGGALGPGLRRLTHMTIPRPFDHDSSVKLAYLRLKMRAMSAAMTTPMAHSARLKAQPKMT
jgi:hypothetical protein